MLSSLLVHVLCFLGLTYSAFNTHTSLLLCATIPGSPLVVSLIGALLKEKPNRWHYYLRQLQQKQFKRIRKSSSYDYDALDQAMAASIEVLPDEHRELYKDLTVLEKDIKVPAKVWLQTTRAYGHMTLLMYSSLTEASSSRCCLCCGTFSRRRWRTFSRSLSTSLCFLWTATINPTCTTSTTFSLTSWWSRIAPSSRFV